MSSKHPIYLCDKRSSFQCGWGTLFPEQKIISLAQTEREIAIRCARENSCRLPRPSRLIILIWLRFISAWWFVCSRSFVRSFVRFYPRNIAFKSANSLGLSLKLITSWRTLSTEPSPIPVSFSLSLSRAQLRTISTCLQPAETLLGLSRGDSCTRSISSRGAFPLRRDPANILGVWLFRKVYAVYK